MGFAGEWLELLVILLVLVAITIIGATGFYQYLDKARLTLSVAAMNKAQDALKNYKAMHRAFPASLEFSDCSDQNHVIVLSCDEVKADINSLLSYTGTTEKFILKAKAKDSQGTFITVTELAISF